MRRCELLALWLATGCTAAFGIGETEVIDASDPGTSDGEVLPDRDRDGIPDRDDPCIASIADALGDYDGDSATNDTDGCPFDFLDNDTDGDTIFDECDPLRTLGGDSRRCVMAFQNPTITRELFAARPTETASWDLLEVYGIVGTGTGTLVAAERLEATGTTIYDLYVVAGAPLPSSEAAVTLWLRTNAAAAATDVGCELRGDGSSTTLALRGGAAIPSPPISLGFARGWKLQAIVEPSVTGMPNVQCLVHPAGSAATTTVQASIALPAGTPGFGVEGNTATFAGLSVLERTDAPPL